MSVSLYEMNLPQYEAKVSKKVGLVNLNAYRIEKEWADLKKETEDFIAEQAKHKEHLDKWFTNFAELLDLRNEKYEPMGYYQAMDRRYFLTSTTVVTSTAVLVPSLIYAAEAASEAMVRQSQELIEYTSETVNKLNDYALGAILPSLVPLMLYAYTQELMYIILFLFLLISSGIILL